MPEWLEKLPPKQKQLAFWGFSLLGAAAIASVFFFLLYSPKRQEVARLKQELQQKQQELQQAKRTDEELRRIKVEIEAAQAELTTLEVSLPPEEYVPTLLREIENLGRQTRGQIAALSPGQIQQVGGSTPQQGTPTVQAGQTADQQAQQAETAVQYSQIPLSIPYVGSYNSMMQFLEQIAAMPIVIVIDSITINKTSDFDSVDGTPLLSVQMPANVYLLPKGQGSV